MDYSVLQHMEAAQGAVELHQQMCEARDKEATVEETAGSMADVEDTMPPAKRRHGWDPDDGVGGTATPIVQVGDLGGLAEEDFPVLDGGLDAQTPTPTAGVIKSLKADTRQAIASSYKGKKGAKDKAKNKGGGKGKTFHVEQADELLEAPLTKQDPQGTPVAGAESGQLGFRQAGGSMSSGSMQPSATSSGEQPAAQGPGAESGDPKPTPSPIPLPSGAGEAGKEDAGAGPSSAAGQPSGQAPLNQ